MNRLISCLCLSLLLFEFGMRSRLIAQSSQPIIGRIAETPSTNPFVPAQYGVIAVGYAVNWTFITFEDDGPDGPAPAVQAPFGGMGDGVGITGGLIFSRPFWKTDVTAAARVSSRLYQDYFLGINKNFGKVQTGFEASNRVLPQQDFFGEGPDSLERNRSDFYLQEDAVGWSTSAALSGLQFRHAVRLRRLDVREGTDPWLPSTQSLFPESEVDGGYTDTDWLTNEFGVMIDRRDDAMDPRSGAAVDVSFTVNNGIRHTESNYATLRVLNYLYFPFSERLEHVLAVRSELVDNTSGDSIPFYVQPTLGGSTTLRGFREYRFRDRDGLALTAEYRYRIWRHSGNNRPYNIDAVVFGDAGQVYPDIFHDIDDRRLHTAAGIGLRFHSNVLNVRISTGRSSEGARFWLRFGPPSW